MRKNFIKLIALIWLASLFLIGIYYYCLSETEYVVFKLVTVDTTGDVPKYVYSDKKIIDRELKSRYVLGLINNGVPVKLDRYKRILIPKDVFDNLDFMLNFSSRINDEKYLKSSLFPDPDSIYFKINDSDTMYFHPID